MTNQEGADRAQTQVGPARCSLIYHVLLIGALTILCEGLFPTHGHGDQQDIIEAGRQEFQRYCATCHGTDAKGHGPSAEFLLAKPADLTQLKKQHGGVFLFWRTYDIIEGSKDRVIRGHGSRDMPIWGDTFRQANGNEHHVAGVRGRILSLVHYLQSIQADE